MHGSIVDPRELLRAIKNANPSADKEALLILFKERLMEAANKKALASVIERYFADAYVQLFSARLAASRAQQRERLQRMVRERVAHIKRNFKIMLLDMVLPTGKLLRNSTKEECRASGGWLTEVADKLRAGQKVGGTIPEETLRAIFDKWAMPKAA